MVQALVSTEAREEMALLAVGRVSRAARRARRILYDGRRAPSRTRVVLALSCARTCRFIRHRLAAGRPRTLAGGVLLRLSGAGCAAGAPLSRAPSSEEGLRPSASRVRAGCGRRATIASRRGRHRRSRHCSRLAHAGPRAAHRRANHLDGPRPGRAEVGGARRERCVRAAVASRKLRRGGDRSACQRNPCPHLRQDQHLSRNRRGRSGFRRDRYRRRHDRQSAQVASARRAGCRPHARACKDGLRHALHHRCACEAIARRARARAIARGVRTGARRARRW